MAHPDPHDPATDPSAAHHSAEGLAAWHSLFPPQEWDDLRREDRQAARNIVVLLTTVFLTGLVMYLGIAFIVA
jgi:hypothetical protein